MRFITHHEVKQELVGDRMRAVIVGKFGMGNVVSPRSGLVSTEDPEVHFNFLVYLFSFSIRLRVVGSGERKIIFQELSEFSSEGGCKLGASVRDDFVVETEMEVDFVEKEYSNTFGSDVLLCGTENHPLSKPMVNHDQEGIKSSRKGEVSDEVTGDLLEGARCQGANGGERGNSRVSIGLVLLASRTTFNVFVDIGG